jgi:hypothetical protein
MKERGLQDYVDALGGLGGFDLEEYDSDEDAADDLRQYTDTEHVRAREFLDEVLFSCGWRGEKTEEEYDIPLRSTTYLRAFKPSEIVKGSGRNSEGSCWMPPTQSKPPSANPPPGRRRPST